MLDYVMLLAAGFVGGVINTVAGGGSFVTFPALLLAGIPPVSANATNTFASCSGYLGGAYALRREIAAHRARLPRLALISLLGGIVGAGLLLRTPEAAFRAAIPWLMLLATVLFIFGGRINQALRRYAAGHRHASLFGRLALSGMLFGVCLYGGFFNAGLGIILLSYLALAGYSDIHAMNGLKLLMSSLVSLAAIVLFVYAGVIEWHQGTLVLFGTLCGGFVAGRYSRRLPQQPVRALVVIASVLITAYFFFDIYFARPTPIGAH